jgi:hypothetical protein
MLNYKESEQFCKFNRTEILYLINNSLKLIPVYLLIRRFVQKFFLNIISIINLQN